MSRRADIAAPGRRSRLPRPWALLACCLCLGGALALAPAAQAQPPVLAGAEAPAWADLGAQEQQILAPLQRDWATLEPHNRSKWLELAQRHASLAPEEQARMQARMAEWARMSPDQRAIARQQFKAARQLPADELQLRWREYQSLPPAERQRLSRQARTEAPAPDRAQPAGGADASPAAGRPPPADAVLPQAKSNLVQPRALPPARTVGPAQIQAAPGGTTRPLGSQPEPAHHQQSGLPKIAATPGFVDRSTLLPQRGPQGVAAQPAAPAPAASRAEPRGRSPGASSGPSRESPSRSPS